MGRILLGLLVMLVLQGCAQKMQPKTMSSIRVPRYTKTKISKVNIKTIKISGYGAFNRGIEDKSLKRMVIKQKKTERYIWVLEKVIASIEKQLRSGKK